MSSRVTVNVVARDLTRAELGRMRHNFNSLGQDMDRAMGNRTRQNFQRLSQSIAQSRRDLTRLRGTIPDDEFFRLDAAIRRAQGRMSRGFRRTDLNQVRRDVDRVRAGFRDLDESARIRVRVDMSALRRADAQLAAWRLRQGRNAVRVPVNPDVDRNRFRRILMAPLRGIGGLIGGTLSDGIGQGIANGVKAAGPAFGVILVGIIAGLASIVGAALAGLFVVAFGLAFATLGGFSAARSKEVQKDWTRTLDHLKKLFAEVGEPMIPVLQHGIALLDDMATRATPAIQKALEDAAPSIQTLMDKIMEGFERFGKVAFKPLMDAFSLFAPVFGDVWSDFMNSLAKEFKEMAGLVSDHSAEIEIALRIVFGAVTLLIKIVNYLAEAWIATLGAMGDAGGAFLTFIRGLTYGMLGLVDGILTGIAGVESVLPGVGHKARDMRDAFREFRKGVDEDLKNAADSLYGFDGRLAETNKRRKIELSIQELTAKLTKARNDLNKTSNTKAKAKVQANIDQLTTQLRSARRQLDALNGKTATTYVYTYKSTVQGGHPTQRYSRATGGVVGAAMAHGGIRSALGGASRNMTLVGEQGPELAELAAGSRVRSNPDTRRILGQAGGDGGVYQVNLVVDGKTLATAIFDPHREIVRNKGGLARAYGG